MAVEARVSLTAGELDALRNVFDNRRWPKAEIVVTREGLRSLDVKLYELSVKTRWPGTKNFDHEAAYRKELLERVRMKLATALDMP